MYPGGWGDLGDLHVSSHHTNSNAINCLITIIPNRHFYIGKFLNVTSLISLLRLPSKCFSWHRVSECERIMSWIGIFLEIFTHDKTAKLLHCSLAWYQSLHIPHVFQSLLWRISQGFKADDKYRNIVWLNTITQKMLKLIYSKNLLLRTYIFPSWPKQVLKLMVISTNLGCLGC